MIAALLCALAALAWFAWEVRCAHLDKRPQWYPPPPDLGPHPPPENHLFHEGAIRLPPRRDGY